MWKKLRRYGFALGLESIKLVDRELQPEVVLSGVFKEFDDKYQALVRSLRKKATADARQRLLDGVGDNPAKEAYARIADDKLPPVASVLHSTSSGIRYTSNPSKVWGIVTSAWDSIYDRASGDDPEVDRARLFRVKFGHLLPGVKVRLEKLQGSDLYEQVHGMDESVGGMDGFTLRELEHLFWKCERQPIVDIRKRYVKAIDEHVGRLGAWGQRAVSTMAFRTTSIIEEHEDITHFNAHRQPFDLRPHRALAFIVHQSEWWQEGYRRTFSDGSVQHPDNQRLAAGGFAVFHGVGHPRNFSKALGGRQQTPYRAGLAGLVYAVQTAWTPTWITLDSEAVVNQAILFLHTRVPAVSGNALDLWKRFKEAVLDRPFYYFRVTWIKGHLDDDVPCGFFPTGNRLEPDGRRDGLGGFCQCLARSTRH